MNLRFLGTTAELAVTIAGEVGAEIVHLSTDQGACVEIALHELDELVTYVKDHAPAPAQTTEGAAPVVQEATGE